MNLAFLFKGKSFVGMSPRPCGARALKDIVTSERQLLKKAYINKNKCTQAKLINKTTTTKGLVIGER